MTKYALLKLYKINPRILYFLCNNRSRSSVDIYASRVTLKCLFRKTHYGLVEYTIKNNISIIIVLGTFNIKNVLCDFTTTFVSNVSFLSHIVVKRFKCID